ncbi:MAG: hypothetical protein CM15mP103_12250 [Gammaproteobacteria bacterium]|nr:MAG: hypothetical protein CM15mP103_12250 [Gammaproteobacteria bacterium]
MEALTAASIAALTLYDMCKAMDRGMSIEQTQLFTKQAGRAASGSVSITIKLFQHCVRRWVRASLSWTCRTSPRPLLRSMWRRLKHCCPARWEWKEA